jgi:hypothetical protein
MRPGVLQNRARWVLWAALTGALGWISSAWLTSNRITDHARPHTAPLTPLPPSQTSSPPAIPLLHERLARCFADPPAAAADDAARQAALERSLSLENAGVRGSLVRRVAYWIVASRCIDSPKSALTALVPLAAREGALGDNGPALRSLNQLLDEWARRDPEGALQALSSLPSECFAPYGVILGTGLLQAKATANPDAAIQFILDHIPVHCRMGYWGLITREIVDLDLDTARSALTRMTGDRSEAVYAILEKWAESDPLAALTWGNRVYPGANPSYGEVALVAWGKRDPVAAIEAGRKYRIRNISDTEDTIVRDWMARDPTAALAWCLNQGQDRRNFETWLSSSVEPQEIIAAARAVSPEAERAIAIATAKSWSRQDPPAALAWIQSLPHSPETDQARMAMLASLGDWSNPPEVREFANAHFETLWRPNVDLSAVNWGFYPTIPGHVSGLLGLLLDTPDSGRARLRELATPENMMFTDLLYQLSRLNPPLTAELMAPHLGHIKPTVSLEILSYWSSREPVDAARFVVDHAEELKPALEVAMASTHSSLIREIADAVRPHDASLAKALDIRFPAAAPPSGSSP